MVSRISEFFEGGEPGQDLASGEFSRQLSYDLHFLERNANMKEFCALASAALKETSDCVQSVRAGSPADVVIDADWECVWRITKDLILEGEAMCAFLEGFRELRDRYEDAKEHSITTGDRVLKANIECAQSELHMVCAAVDGAASAMMLGHLKGEWDKADNLLSTARDYLAGIYDGQQELFKYIDRHCLSLFVPDLADSRVHSKPNPLWV